MTTFERRRLVVGAVAFVLLFLVAMVFAVRGIQDDRAAFVERQLQAAGLTGIEVEFSGRNGTLVGPAAQAEVALAAVTDRSGLRSLGYRTPTAADDGASSTTTIAGGAGTTAAVAPTTPAVPGLGVFSTVAGPIITLTGTVPADADKQALAAAATTAFGATRVVDQVQAVGGAWDPAGQTAFEGVKAYIAAAGARLRNGTVRQAAGTMTADGAGFSPAATAALNQSLATIRAGGVPVEGGIQDPVPPADAAAVQGGLNDLVGRTGINFASGSATLDAPAQAVLDVAAQIITAGPASTVINVQGHTDNVGSDATNQRVSGQRAQAVRAYLASKGVPAARIQANGFGAARPVADNATEEGRAQNRRIELIVTGS